MEVKLCIVCDSAVGVSVFATMAMQVIQPMVLRLQEKYPGCKLTVGVVTYTTPTNRPAIVARKAFTSANTIFPMFKADPHSLGIGTSGTGGVVGTAVLEGLVAGIEMFDDALEAPTRKLRMRHPSIEQPQQHPPPVCLMLLIGGSRAELARRPLYNHSASLDDTTWETLPDELQKRNINLSLCLSAQIKELTALHAKIWPTPDAVWFPNPKNYTILLSGTHLPNAKRQIEQTGLATAKRIKHESPKPTARPIPPHIDLPAPSFPSQTPTQVPQPPSIPPAMSHPPSQNPNPPVPAPPAVPASQTSPPTNPNAITENLHRTYRQLHSMFRNPNAVPEQLQQFARAGFRVDPSGAFIGAAGVIFDAQGQPGPGANIAPAMHPARREQQARLALAASGVGGMAGVMGGPGGVGVGGGNVTNPAVFAQQQARMAQVRSMLRGEGLPQMQPAQGQAPGQPQLQPGQSQPGQSQQQPGQAQTQPVSHGSPSKSQGHSSPAHVHRSPSHTHAQPPAQTAQQQQHGQGVTPSLVVPPVQQDQAAAPMNAQQPGQPQQSVGILPPHPQQQLGGIPPQQSLGGTPQGSSTPQHVVSTPQHVGSTPQHVGSTPQQQVGASGTPQLAHSTPRLSHSTPQLSHSTPQLSHSTPQQTHTPQAQTQTPNSGTGVHRSPQNSNLGIPQNPNVPQNQGQNPNMAQQNVLPNQAQNAAQNPSVPTGAPNPAASTSTPSIPASNLWNGQIVYSLQQRVDQEPAQLHFHAVAVGGPGHRIETNLWPTRLHMTTGFRLLPRQLATQLYGSPVPFGQITIASAHAVSDQQKWAVFHKVISAGYCAFYEFPPDPAVSNPSPQQGGRGILFFSAPGAPGRVLFKAFVHQLCPPGLCRGGQPAGPALMGNANAPGNGATPAAGSGPAAGVAPAMVPGAGVGMVPGAGGIGMLPGVAPGAGAGMGMVPGGASAAGMIPGAGRPNPTPTPPNPNQSPAIVPGAGGINPGGMNPAMMQGLNGAGVPGLNPAAMPGLNPAGMPGFNPGAGVQAPNGGPQLTMQQTLSRMALARLGITPAQLTSATPAQKEQIARAVQQLVLQMQQQQQMAAAGAQPSLERVQAFLRQQQQQQQQQNQQR